MATVTGFTAERMEAIEAASVVDGNIVGDDLVLTRFDGSTINAGDVRGPTGSPGVSAEELEDELQASIPIGGVIDYLGTVSPNNRWLTMVGQTVVNAQTLYPIWWARTPASMKSGANIVMPDTRGRVMVSQNTSDSELDTIGETGGAKTVILGVSEMPNHGHVQNPHNHGQDAHNHNQAAHNHEQGPHAHTSEPHTHYHNHSHGMFSGGSWVVQANSGGGFALGANAVSPGTGVDFFLGYSVTAGVANAYTDGTAVTTHTTYATNNPETAINYAATATNQPATATNQNTGGGGAHTNMQPFIVMLKLIRVQ